MRCAPGRVAVVAFGERHTQAIVLCLRAQSQSPGEGEGTVRDCEYSCGNSQRTQGRAPRDSGEYSQSPLETPCLLSGSLACGPTRKTLTSRSAGTHLTLGARAPVICAERGRVGSVVAPLTAPRGAGGHDTPGTAPGAAEKNRLEDRRHPGVRGWCPVKPVSNHCERRIYKFIFNNGTAAARWLVFG